MNMKTGMAVGAAMCAMVGVAQGQQTLKMDVNQFSFTPTGSLTDVGTVGGYDDEISWTLGAGEFEEISLGFGGRTGAFSEIITANVLTALTGYLEFEDDVVTMGSFRITVQNGDYYEATVTPGSGSLVVAGSAYSLDAFTWDGAFKDSGGLASTTFGDIDVSDWTAYQGIGRHLFGEFMKINFGSAGIADMEVFVMVPLPPAAYAGLGMLAGVMGLSYVLRRR